MRWSVLGSASSLAIAAALAAGPASAAPPVYNWTGFYVGADAGYGWGQSHESTDFGKWNVNGGVFGVHGGYNHQFQSFVVGFEADAMMGTVKGTSDDIFFAGKTSSMRSKMDWAGTVRVRAGVPIENFLIYGTGGVAFGDWTNRLTISGFGDVDKFKDTKFHVGWTAGVGGEYAFSPQFSARVEYLYMDFGKERYNLGGEPMRVSEHLNLIRFGLTYRFAPPPPP